MYWMNHKKIYFTLSGIFLIISVFSLFKWRLKLGIDFTGGSIIEYKLSKSLESSQITDKLEEIGVSNLTVNIDSNSILTIDSSPLTPETKSRVDEAMKSIDNNITDLRYEVVGPTIGPELVQKTVYALMLSAFLILLWVAYQFKNIKYGMAATLATLHDSLVLLGSFSLMGHFMGIEVDFLFVTAMLTILSFSVHDTIIVFDRIREVSKKTAGDLTDIANAALTQTMVRSLNNSFTIIFMLVALMLLGGDTIKWFAIALLIGTISGTYSSPFVAVPLLITFDKVRNFKFRLKK